MSMDQAHEPIAVALRQTDSSIECKVTWQDEDTSDYDLKSVSMHSAKREVRAWLARDGYRPVDRWKAAAADPHQILRHFARPPANDRLAPLVR
jgi:hypothetical protein